VVVRWDEPQPLDEELVFADLTRLPDE